MGTSAKGTMGSQHLRSSKVFRSGRVGDWLEGGTIQRWGADWLASLEKSAQVFVHTLPLKKMLDHAQKISQKYVWNPQKIQKIQGRFVPEHLKVVIRCD